MHSIPSAPVMEYPRARYTPAQLHLIYGKRFLAYSPHHRTLIGYIFLNRSPTRTWEDHAALMDLLIERHPGFSVEPESFMSLIEEKLAQAAHETLAPLPFPIRYGGRRKRDDTTPRRVQVVDLTTVEEKKRPRDTPAELSTAEKTDFLVARWLPTFAKLFELENLRTLDVLMDVYFLLPGAPPVDRPNSPRDAIERFVNASFIHYGPDDWVEVLDIVGTIESGHLYVVPHALYAYPSEKKVEEEPPAKKPRLDGGEAGNCCICMTTAINSVFLNCGHLAACITCAQALARKVTPTQPARCPICRSPIHDVIRTFHIDS
jgi:hypothetical protein